MKHHPNPRQFQEAREAMVKRQLQRRGIRDRRVLRAMRVVPRHLFVPEEYQSEAYEDHPLPIGQGQTISQPYMVALMSELLNAGPGDTVLEVGAGCGYQTAVLLEMGLRVFAIERLPELFDKAQKNLNSLGLQERLHLVCADGTKGWPESTDVARASQNFCKAPEKGFERILVAAAAPEVPPILLRQLRDGHGRMILPLGGQHETQRLECLTKTGGHLNSELVSLVRFVPLVQES